MVASRLRTSRAPSARLWAPANSNLRRRLAAALPVLISISSSAKRAAPRASRFFVFSPDYSRHSVKEVVSVD